MVTVVTKDDAGNIASIENGNLIIFNRTDDRIKVEIPFQKAGDIIDILRIVRESHSNTRSIKISFSSLR